MPALLLGILVDDCIDSVCAGPLHCTSHVLADVSSLALPFSNRYSGRERGLLSEMEDPTGDSWDPVAAVPSDKGKCEQAGKGHRQELGLCKACWVKNTLQH